MTGGQPGPGWTLVPRRQPIRIAGALPQGGYADVYELICCYRGDGPGLDYRHVSPELQPIRGPYPIAAGIAAYGRHAGHHRQVRAIHGAAGEDTFTYGVLHGRQACQAAQIERTQPRFAARAKK